MGRGEDAVLRERKVGGEWRERNLEMLDSYNIRDILTQLEAKSICVNMLLFTSKLQFTYTRGREKVLSLTTFHYTFWQKMLLFSAEVS